MSSTNESHPAKRMIVLVVGGALVLLGIVLLVLPGPGLLLVLGNVLRPVTYVNRYIDPIHHRAMQAPEQSASSPLRLTCSILAGIALIVAGVVWGVVKTLPLGGWPTGSSLILSGLVLLGLLVFSYARVQRRRRFGRIR